MNLSNIASNASNKTKQYLDVFMESINSVKKDIGELLPDKNDMNSSEFINEGRIGGLVFSLGVASMIAIPHVGNNPILAVGSVISATALGTLTAGSIAKILDNFREENKFDKPLVSEEEAKQFRETIHNEVARQMEIKKTYESKDISLSNNGNSEFSKRITGQQKSEVTI